MADAEKAGTLEADANEVLIPKLPKSKKGKKLLFLGAGLAFVIIAIFAGVSFFAPGFISKEKAQGTEESMKGIDGHIYSMEPFLVNLAHPDQRRYLKVRIDIESTEKKPNEEYVQRLSQLRDGILSVLSSKSYEDIYNSQGKTKLKEEIISKLNQLLSRFKVNTIYFTEFVVQ